LHNIVSFDLVYREYVVSSSVYQYNDILYIISLSLGPKSISNLKPLKSYDDPL